MGAAHTVACPDAPQTRVTGFTLPERVISYPPASKSTTNYMEDRRRVIEERLSDNFTHG